MEQLKKMEKKFAQKSEEMKNGHQVEMQKAKELFQAAEKMRREKWVEEKTKKIKEITVRGLEPEIQKLIARHKAEVKKVIGRGGKGEESLGEEVAFECGSSF